MGPETLMRYIDPGEYVKRLAAAQGIEVLNLIKTEETMEADRQQQMQQYQQKALVDQAGQLAGSPIADPSKNPALGRTMNDGYDQLTWQNENNQGEQAPTGEEEAPPEG